ncbi:MAG: ribonuclease Z [Cyanobacteria bacterium NC_groundwater_1444_Ag_S-0.65um_54_12]|nr:ribonuclease Z [Cyanobacteria bacterium NC_groundwater_1444_Ag_S-0.65um_54_12]
MELTLTFLGTAGAVPTPSRSLSATLLQRGGERFLIDCGEGTQRQLIKAAVGITQIQRILLTHFHADHYLGIPGMFKTWQLWGRTEPVEVFGPRGLSDMLELFRRLIGRVDFPIRWQELVPGDVLTGAGYRVVAIATDHRIASVGYAFYEEARPGRFCPERAAALGIEAGPAYGQLQHGETVTAPGGRVVHPSEVMGPVRPGRRVVLTGDTRPCPAVVEAATDADVLVHEATFTNAERERAGETGHATAAEAALVARAAQVRLLVLTHSSFRHTARDLLQEARPIMEPCLLPADFDRLIIPFSERGAPQLLRPGQDVPSADQTGLASQTSS